MDLLVLLFYLLRLHYLTFYYLCLSPTLECKFRVSKESVWFRNVCSVPGKGVR